MKKKVVVIGNGMAGARVVEEILKRKSDFDFEIVMFGAEPYGNYNRILLSNVLNQTQSPDEIIMNPLSWYEENNIKLHAGVRVVNIERDRKILTGRRLPKGFPAYQQPVNELQKCEVLEESYDELIIATGSRPFIPPIKGFGLPGTFQFRTVDDCDAIARYAKNCDRAVVIGGGLLGLEAARGLMTHDLKVTIVEAAPQVMLAQLDEEAALMLKGSLESMGITVLPGVITTEIVGEEGTITHLNLRDGSTYETDMVVVSAGIRPITEVANSSGLTVEKGIVCDDQMKTSDPNVFAVGECVEHRGVLYGLVEPIWEQCRVVADVLTRCGIDAQYTGSKLGTKLKVMGVDLVSMGDKNPTSPDDEVVVYRDPNRGLYKKLIVRDNKVQGAILLGDTGFSNVLMQLFLNDGDLPENRAEVLFDAVEGTSLLNAADLPDSAQVCNCNGVCKKDIVEAINNDGCKSVSAIGVKTKAGKGCGSCRGLIAQIIEGTLGEVGYDPSEHYYVTGVPLEKSQLVAEIRTQKLKSVSSVFEVLAGGKEDPDSKVGLASLLKTIWPGEYDDQRDARFINDRVHGNIQKDGTFSVVPRIYGGVTTPDELLRIAKAAVKYKAKMVKITGGQRIDLLGIKKNDLPKIWKDIGMPSGHAYAKSFRTCKSCVGTDFCRFGLGDSISLAQQIEMRYQGIESPHKVKMAVTGCPRNCAEAYIKDVGIVAVEGEKWEMYIGGAAGSIIRKGDLFCIATSPSEIFQMIDRFIEYYRQHAKYLERTFGFVERVGVDVLKGILIEDSLGVCVQLEEKMQEAVDAYKDPWKEADIPAYEGQFEEPRLVEVLSEINNNG